MGTLRLNRLSTRHVGPIECRVEAAECVCIHGASGSGKTLLLRAIADLDPHQGEALLDGAGCSTLPPPQWRRSVALVVAESQWWSEHVREHFEEPSFLPLRCVTSHDSRNVTKGADSSIRSR